MTTREPERVILSDGTVLWPGYWAGVYTYADGLTPEGDKANRQVYDCELLDMLKHETALRAVVESDRNALALLLAQRLAADTLRVLDEDEVRQ